MYRSGLQPEAVRPLLNAVGDPPTPPVVPPCSPRLQARYREAEVTDGERAQISRPAPEMPSAVSTLTRGLQPTPLTRRGKPVSEADRRVLKFFHHSNLFPRGHSSPATTHVDSLTRLAQPPSLGSMSWVASPFHFATVADLVLVKCLPHLEPTSANAFSFDVRVSHVRTCDLPHPLLLRA